MLFLSVIEFMITNNSGQTLLVKPADLKMGSWEKTLDSQLANNRTTKGIVSNVHVCHKHLLHMSCTLDWYAGWVIDERTKCVLVADVCM